MSSDDDDLLCYTPLQRSCVSSSQRKPKPRLKPSRLSLSQRTQSQATKIKNKADKNPVVKISPSKAKKRTSRNNTPVKSRADKPEENCSAFELAKWHFLFGSDAGKAEQKPQALIRKEDPGRASQSGACAHPPSQKRKTDPEEDEQPSGSKKPNGGFCPHCKFPCDSMKVKEFHVAQCERKDLSSKPKCPKGSRCSSTAEVHYWIHDHTNQTKEKAFGVSSRGFSKFEASDGLVDMSDNDDGSASDSGFNGATSHSISKNPSKPEALCESPDFLQRSDAEEDDKSITLFDFGSESDEDRIDHTRRDTTHQARRDSSDAIRKEIVDHTSRDSIDHTNGETSDLARRETVDYTSRDSSDLARRENVDHTSRDSSDLTRKDTVEHIRRDSDDRARKDSVDQIRRESFEFTKGETSHHTKDSVASGSTVGSSAVLDLPLIPDVELVEDDKTTVYFGSDDRSEKSSLFNEEEGEENQPAPLTHPPQNDSSGSRTPDLGNIPAEQDEAGDLLDSEGDELVGSVVEEAISNFAMPALEKVMKWRMGVKESHETTSQEQRQDPSSRSHRRLPPPPCIHLHFHEASPATAPSSGKESGQTSILQFFKSTKPQEESCTCGGGKAVTKEESAAAWKGLMGRMQKRQLVRLPSISDSSSQDVSHQSHVSLTRNDKKFIVGEVSDSTSKAWRQKSQVKTCPFYKYIPDTGFVVDAFNYGTLDGVKAYFLSHFHYDHYIGLKKNFTQPIYCSEITAKLVNKKLGVSPKYLHPLPMWEPQQVHGVKVTLLSANHCPGSVMFLFTVKPGVTHLHVGDFRAHPSMENYPALECSINTLFLDTTYCSPEYDFPPQEKIIEKCVSIAQEHHQKNSRTLFVVGSYTIGKERVFKAIAESLNCSIWVRSYKKQILNCIDDKEILSRLTDNSSKAKVHVLPMTEVKGGKLKEYLSQFKAYFSEIVGLCPTGWEFTGASNGGDLDEITSRHPFPGVHTYGIPYSEHSSFSELRKFVQFIRPQKILPTVNNGNQATRKKMEKYFREWLAGGQLFH